MVLSSRVRASRMRRRAPPIRVEEGISAAWSCAVTGENSRARVGAPPGEGPSFGTGLARTPARRRLRSGDVLPVNSLPWNGARLRTGYEESGSIMHIIHRTCGAAGSGPLSATVGMERGPVSARPGFVAPSDGIDEGTHAGLSFATATSVSRSLSCRTDQRTGSLRERTFFASLGVSAWGHTSRGFAL